MGKFIDLTLPEKEARVKFLYDQLKHHDNLYFIQNKSEISDSEYDLIKKEYDGIVKEYPSLSQYDKVIATPIPKEGLELQELDKTMLSLSKCLNKDELNVWKQKVFDAVGEDVKFVYEYKLDGLSLDITYYKGNLVRILTRGDGYTGEDITHNASIIKNLPVNIDVMGWVTIRGEGYLTYKDYIRLNEVTDNKYNSPRNAAAGILRTLPENQIIDEPLLSFNAYDYTQDIYGWSEYSGMMESCLEYTGIPSSPEVMIDVIELDKRSDEYPVDGVVIKVDNTTLQNKLGVTNQFPNWATAYKFPPLVGVSSVTGINFFTGKTGKVTPVVNYKPVKIGDVICNKASLHNYSLFTKLGLCIGTKIEVARKGDVIPQVTNIVEIGHGEVVKAPHICPSCNGILEIVKGDGDTSELFCTNKAHCPAQLHNRLAIFVGKKAFDMKGVGKVLLGDLVKEGLVKYYSDIFSLDEAQLLQVGVKGKQASNAIDSIKRSRKVPINKFITGLNVPNVGEGLSKIVSRYINTITDIIPLLTDFDKLVAMPGIGISTAMEICTHCKDPNVIEEINELLSLVDIIMVNNSEESLTPICITGSTDVVRDDLVKWFAEKGFDLKESVTGKTKALLVGRKPSNIKVGQAGKKGIMIVEIPEPFNMESIINEINAL